MVSINFEITIEVEIVMTVEIVVEVEYSEEYGITMEYEEESISEEEPEVEIDYDIDVNGWESWGGDAVVPARGWFDQGGNKNSVDFYDFRKFDGGDLRGAGSDAIGEFDLFGRMNGEFFTFNKVYRGAHTVVYRGVDRNGVLTGTWEIPGNCDGVFNILTGWQRWKGKFYQGGDGNEMSFSSMYVGDSGVVGRGSDDIGQFAINGWKNGSTVCFAKHYQGAHTVYYQGELDGRKLKGRWEIPGNCNGKFKLKSKRDF